MPIQLSGSLVITGSITTTGVITMSGSIASASYSSTSDLLQGTGSVGFATTASFNAVSASLLQVSASYTALSGSYNVFSGSASTRVTQIEQVYATTGSNSFRADQSITGSLVVSSTITAQTLVVQTVTSSIVFSSGSNTFGNQLANNQTFTGSVNITGSLAIAGNITGNAITLTGALTGTSATFSGSVTAGGSVTIGTGGNYTTGSIYSDGSWGMIFRAKQASPSNAEYRWAKSDDSELMRISPSGGLQIGTTPDAGFKLDVSGTSRFTGQTTFGNTLQVTGNANVPASGAGIELAGSTSATGITSFNRTLGTYLASGHNALSYSFAISGVEKFALAASTGAATFSSSVTATTYVEIIGDLRFNSSGTDRKIYFRGSTGSPDTNWSMGTLLTPTGATVVTSAATVIDVFGGAAGYGFMVRNTSNVPLLQIAGNTGAATFSSSVQATGVTVASDVIGDPVYLRVRNNNTGGYPSSLALSLYGYSSPAAYFDALRIQATYPGYGLTNFHVKYQSNSADVNALSIRGDGYILMLPTYGITTGNAANIYMNSDGGLYRSTSSLKYKIDVRDYDKGLNKVMKMRPVYYKGKSEQDGGKQFAGLIAEEVHELGLTEFVQYAEDGTPDALAYQNMIALAFKAIQEQQAQIESQDAKIEELKAMIAAK